MIKLSPSILAADFTILGEQLAELEKTAVSYLHIDVMDGIFVPSISFGMPLIKSIRKATDKVFDVHLMIMDPERYIDEFKECGADIITFHLEATDAPRTLIEKIHSHGIRAGITVRPETPIELLYPYLDDVEMALIMSVNPGFGGQEFIPEALGRIKKLREYIDFHHLDTDVQVDGGICHENVRDVIAAGANVIVAGSAIFGGDIPENVKRFLCTIS
ncbi:MAG: ribulose-phosphate 3-epimerase [Lachnospiraceae bacterium]|jgi:ribulose-phosphate 3-epimerase|nr:ribulose-phosphate 3-epimerase [Lachnospiraceae bacterium]